MLTRKCCFPSLLRELQVLGPRFYSGSMLLNVSRGRTGLGLLILRCTVAIVVLIIGNLHLMTGRQTAPSVMLMGLAILIGLGLFTSISSALTGIIIVTLMLTSLSELTVNCTLAMLCIAVTLMGAGAYSIDGVLHGARRITLPKS